MAKKKLTDKQKMFVKEYLVDLNATQAYIRAGYKPNNADKAGPELIGNTRVAEAIQKEMNKRSEKVEIKAEDVLTGIKDLTKLVANPVNEEFNATAGFKGYELLGKHLKLFTDKVEVNGKISLDTMGDDELDNMIDNLKQDMDE